MNDILFKDKSEAETFLAFGSPFWLPLMKSLHKHASVGGDRGGVGKKAQRKRPELESKLEAEFYPSNAINLILGLKLPKFGLTLRPKLCSICLGITHEKKILFL